MNTINRVINLEKRLGGGGKEARRFTDVLLNQGIITKDKYDEALCRAIENRSSMKEILQALDGRSLGLPSQMRKNRQEVSL